MSQTKVTYNYNLDEYELAEVQQGDLAKLLELCRKNMKDPDEKLVERAFKLTYLSHDGITRASGEPYYLHPLAVAEIIAEEIGMDDVSVAAALLHDTVEDTDITLKDIEQEFGPVVMQLIDGLTKISGVFKSKNVKQAETFMKLLMYMAEDLRVVLIKFADRLHNMRTIHHLPRKKQLSIATETIELYAPFAHRFGLYKIKSELEDLCFKATDPTGYKFIARKLRDKKESREEFIDVFMEPIREQLERSGFNFEIKGRPKHIYSIYKKMMRQQKPFEEIYDLFAIRIILDEPHTKEDCWRVYSFITDSYTPIPERFRDFVSVPKANGYRSLHTTVITNRGRKVEVQIRTRHMDEIAEKGLAAHWKYKEGAEQQGKEAGLDKFVDWVREVLDNPRPDAATEFVEDFQLNLYSREIYVFTPNGELRTLPQGSTPIDFAFDIHSEIGERAIAAKVNGKMVPLRNKLSSGDQVEIITGKVSNLNPDWINDVVTHKARSRIRQYIRQEERKVSDDGREMWEKKAERYNFELSDQDLAKIANKLEFPSIQAMFFAIGSDSYDVNRLVKAVRSFLSKGRFEGEEEEKAAQKDDKKTEVYDDRIIGDAQTANKQMLTMDGNLDNIKYSFSKCCNPIPGDDVVGYISRNGGLKIHRTNCNNLKHLIKTEPEYIVDVSWSKKSGNQFIGAIKIIGEDRVGLINDISNMISTTLKTNMKSINVSSDTGAFEGTIILYVDDLKHLENVIKRVMKIDGIKQAYRYE
ncbi:MAG: bifunctional (p)ppGpp synthetase/guanosine-3',5'-bis(diphosphate) 3'-pyrophosphohydrolase [Balneolia bacterium]|nr:bifunctional (p)ppGpp synthetase/guanosine-3',5'-bis(diphosphate) 3'-pyrophosphohydrolase [Balneolia bacterium]